MADCPRQAEPGVVSTAPHGLAMPAVLHAVAVNGFYETTPDLVHACVVASLTAAAARGAHRVALTAVATGFGRLSMADFAAAVAPLRHLAFPPIAEIIVRVRSPDERDRVAIALG